MNQRHHTGRHYLKSPDIADLMAKTASITADEDVLEIGTGRCAITPPLRWLKRYQKLQEKT